MLMDVMTKKVRSQMERAQKRLQTCGGDCSHCAKCSVYTSGLSCAVGCDLLPVSEYNSIANGPKSLHKIAAECVDFELHMDDINRKHNERMAKNG